MSAWNNTMQQQVRLEQLHQRQQQGQQDQSGEDRRGQGGDAMAPRGAAERSSAGLTAVVVLLALAVVLVVVLPGAGCMGITY